MCQGAADDDWMCHPWCTARSARRRSVCRRLGRTSQGPAAASSPGLCQSAGWRPPADSALPRPPCAHLQHQGDHQNQNQGPPTTSIKAYSCHPGHHPRVMSPMSAAIRDIALQRHRLFVSALVKKIRAASSGIKSSATSPWLTTSCQQY